MASRKRVSAGRERKLFTENWRFRRGEAPDARRSLAYAKLRDWVVCTGTELISDGVSKPARPKGNPGGKVSFVRPEFDDGQWQLLDLPHDWAISGPFAPQLPGETGKLPWQGVGWYRKRFKLPARDAGRRILLEIDGAMAQSAVWLNGRLVGGWPYGYTSYQLDLTPYVELGGENVLAIRLENPANSSRWYPGSGLYRNVWLVKTSPLRIAHWGVGVTTPRVSEGEAIVNCDVTLDNDLPVEACARLTTTIHELSADGISLGKAVAQAEPSEVELSGGRQACRTLVAKVKRPKLWSLQRRHRYVAVTTVELAGEIVDEVESRFGVRTVSFDADRGFMLNGRVVALQGVCLHHDLGAIGAAVHRRALERQIEILQSMGCNAIRTSHNPPAPELLELCDQMGMLVMDEAFDCWRRGKKWPVGTPEFSPDVHYFDYGKSFDDWHERDLRALVRRDRNHPSVAMWSIGNEVIEQWVSDGWRLGARLAGIVREEDRTRPITAGFNGESAGYSGFQTYLDAIGYNYKPWAYQPLRRLNPTMPVFGAETASCLSSRGEYFFPVEDDKRHGRINFQVSSYDQSAADWASPPDVEFRGLDDCPGAAGEFVWTGFDYLGEPTPYNDDATNLLNFSDPGEKARMAAELERLGKIHVPARSSYFGIIDLAGFPKDRFYIYQARWRPELKMAHILPHWDWPERFGEVTPVHVYSSAREAELFLNGRSQGRRRRSPDEYRFRWDEVAYEPGELKVVTYKNGKRWATSVRRTAGPATRISLEPDRSEITADGADLSFVTLRAENARGMLSPRACVEVEFSIRGPAEILALDNGDPTDQTPFIERRRATFNGLLLCVVRSKRGRSGKIVVRASAAGMKPVSLELTAAAAAARR